MPVLDIPGFGELSLSRLVLDYNGTLALDGELLPGVAERLSALAEDYEIHVLTADTFGSVEKALSGLPCRVAVIPKGGEAASKLDYVKGLGAGNCACLGNGANDRLMLAEAAIGIALVQSECAAVAALTAADLTAPDIRSALDLFLNPKRLAATLRD